MLTAEEAAAKTERAEEEARKRKEEEEEARAKYREESYARALEDLDQYSENALKEIEEAADKEQRTTTFRVGSCERTKENEYGSSYWGKLTELLSARLNELGYRVKDDCGPYTWHPSDEMSLDMWGYALVISW